MIRANAVANTAQVISYKSWRIRTVELDKDDPMD
jgi:hypothetical protein